jgi:hypothetical protein
VFVSVFARNIEYKCKLYLVTVLGYTNYTNLLYRTGSRKRKLSSQDETLENERSYLNHLSPPNYAPYLSSPVIYQQQQRSVPWLDHTWNTQSRRKGSITSLVSVGSDNRHPHHHHFFQHIDRKPSIPFSPPHQSYDHYRPSISNLEHYYHYEKAHHSYQHHQNRTNMIPSPPPQSSLFKPEGRISNLKDVLPPRRQSTGPSLYYRPSDASVHHHSNASRRLSLQQYSPRLLHPPPPSGSQPHRSPSNRAEVIHLPPLRSMIPNSSLVQQTSRQAQGGIVEVDAAVAMMQLASRRQKKQQQQQQQQQQATSAS